MIRVTCGSCGSQLNAKDELAGQVRKCPKCQAPVQIVGTPVPSAPAPAEPNESGEDESNENRTSTVERPEEGGGLPVRRLNRQSRYVLCDNSRVVGLWENPAQGWQVKTNTGLLSATRARDQIPRQGDFRLVELRFSATPDGQRLTGISIESLKNRAAATSIAQGDDKILSYVTGPAGLSRSQKNAVRQAIREHLMRDLWAESQAVLDFLGSADFHTASVG